MVLQVWGVSLSVIEVTFLLQVIAVVLWFFGFTLLYIGRFEMGNSFRLGIPQEDTHLRVDGLYRLSRNPMYVGMYATMIASAAFTLNPVIIILAAFVISVHHSIVLAEEDHMQKVFGREYTDYFNRVKRYI